MKFSASASLWQAAVVIAAHDRSRLDQYLVPGLKVHGVHGGRINVLNNL